MQQKRILGMFNLFVLPSEDCTTAQTITLVFQVNLNVPFLFARRQTGQGKQSQPGLISFCCPVLQMEKKLSPWLPLLCMVLCRVFLHWQLFGDSALPFVQCRRETQFQRKICPDKINQLDCANCVFSGQ